MINKMKRFMLFYADEYYPNGGMNDFMGSYSSMFEAITAAKEKDLKDKNKIKESWEKQGNFTYKFKQFENVWAHIWDSHESFICWEGNSQYEKRLTH